MMLLTALIPIITLSRTVEPLLTHTPRWSPKSMGYQGLWVRRGMLKIDSNNSQKNTKNVKKIGDIY